MSKFNLSISDFFNWVVDNYSVGGENATNGEVLVATSYNRLVVYDEKHNYCKEDCFGSPRENNTIVMRYLDKYVEYILDNGDRFEGILNDVDAYDAVHEMFDNFGNSIGDCICRRLYNTSKLYFGKYFDHGRNGDAYDAYRKVLTKYVNINGQLINLLNGAVASSKVKIPMEYCIITLEDVYVIIHRKVNEYVERLNNEFLDGEEKETTTNVLNYITLKIPNFTQKSYYVDENVLRDNPTWSVRIDDIIRMYHEEHYYEDDEDEYDDDNDDDIFMGVDED